MKAIDNKELIIALEELEKEKGIKKEELLESIRTALITAYKRNFDALENVDVKMDEQTGATHVYAIKEVMERANDDALEISLEDARKINKELNLGDSVEVEIVPRDFGRIAAQTAKQVIIQKLRETERNMIFNEYNERKGEIVTGLVQKADNHIVVLDLGKLEGIMLSKDQIPTEHYKVNDKIKAYVVDVERGEKGAPQAIVSRTHPDFVRKLLEFEIEEAKLHKNQVLLKIKGIDDINEAEKYRGCFIKIPREKAKKLPKDTYFIADLIGLQVYTDSGELLGKVDDIYNSGSADIYVVKDELGKQILLPGIKDVIKQIDVDNEKIIVHLIDGLI